MGNENHDPQNGQFSSGDGGGGKTNPADAHANMDRNAAVAHHASTLTATMGDNEKFDAALANLEKDKSIGKDAMRQVAQQFLGREKMRSSIGRAEALKEIRVRQAINARQDARAANIDKHMKSW